MISFPNSELILITGASSGIGKASALLCNKLGARVVALGRDSAKLQTLKDEAQFPENIFVHARDLSKDLESLTPWVTELKQEYGKFSGFVHCAGYAMLKPFKLFSLEDARAMFDIHYHAGMMLTKGITDRRNCEKSTSIVFISSQATEPSAGGMTIYGSAKGAIDAAVKNIFPELAPQGIRINTISPDHVRTPMAEEGFKNLGLDGVSGIDSLAKDFPLGIIEAEDVANSVVFLLSSASAKITGQNIPILGGKF